MHEYDWCINKSTKLQKETQNRSKKLQIITHPSTLLQGWFHLSNYMQVHGCPSYHNPYAYLQVKWIGHLNKSYTQIGQMVIVVSDASQKIATKSYRGVKQYWQYI